MRFFGHSSNRRSKRCGEAPADDFTFRAPGKHDVKPTRLEIECFKKKPESGRRNPLNQHVNSLESLRSESESEFDFVPSQEIELCLGFERNCNMRSPRSSTSDFNTTSSSGSACSFRSLDSQGNEQPSSPQMSTYTKVLLYPEEEWARNAKTVQWTLTYSSSKPGTCRVIESSIGGSHNTAATGKISEDGDGNLTITGHFKRCKNPDFKLFLTTQVSKSDFQNGYRMTGSLQQGDMTKNFMEATHFAVIEKQIL